MALMVHGLPVAPGVAIGRAVRLAPSHLDVPRYAIAPAQVPAELERLRVARTRAAAELQQLRDGVPPEAPSELAAVLDVHLMMLQDEAGVHAVRERIANQHCNAEWALVAETDQLAQQFDEMEDEYLRARKHDLQQVTERILQALAGAGGNGAQMERLANRRSGAADGAGDEALIVVAHDISPADMLQFRRGPFAAFVTDTGSTVSHTAIVARSLGVPAVVGARVATQLLHSDDLVIVDGDAGLVLVDPAPDVVAAYRTRQRDDRSRQRELATLHDTPARTRDGCGIELLANIEQPDDVAPALAAGARGIGLLRSEFLFLGRRDGLPDEEEQYRAYRRVVEDMQGLPVTIRTVDVGADKVLGEPGAVGPNPALGLRAIRWSLTRPEVFQAQLRAILRAAHGADVRLLVPMLGHASQVRRTLELLAQARAQLEASGQPQGAVRVGAMIEVPAAALSLPLFLRHFDFLSLGTNDLIQYTLAIDRADEAVAHLYDPLHPAVLKLVADTIRTGHAAGKPVTVCGEMAADPRLAPLLLGLGLRSFSMHAAQIPRVKQRILGADLAQLEPWAERVLHSEDPAAMVAAD